MSGIGFWELIILFLIGLIVLGPERLPRVANQLGNWLGQARRMTRVMKRQLEEELDLNSQFKIRPPPPATPANEEDDAFSPAHDKDDVGTGVDDDEPADAEEQIVVSEETEETDDAEEQIVVSEETEETDEPEEIDTGKKAS
jgi:Tat protein translocase TatB subunit